MIYYKKRGLIKMQYHDQLNKFWGEQTERIEKEANLTSGQWTIIMIVVIVGSFILTPIGGVGAAFGLYYGMSRGAKELKGGSEFKAVKDKTVQKLLKKENSEIATLKSKELVNAQNAFSVLEKLLSRRDKDLKELEAEGYDKKDIESKKILFENCKMELHQINESLKIASEENIRLENKILKENIHKKELDKVHKKEVNDRLELLEKAYGAGIINKAEYKKQKLQL